jgi:hypothetical protein
MLSPIRRSQGHPGEELYLLLPGGWGRTAQHGGQDIGARQLGTGKLVDNQEDQRTVADIGMGDILALQGRGENLVQVHSFDQDSTLVGFFCHSCEPGEEETNQGPDL